MTLQEIAARRLANQYLIGTPLPTVAALVRHMLCVQAQDYAGATWAIAQRLHGITAADIGTLYDEGVILRLHMLRPTWHFVHAQDVRWLLRLTSPRAHQMSAYYYRKLGLTQQDFAASEAVCKTVLAGHNYRTRQELKKEFAAAGIDADGLRLTYILLHAEHEGVLCSGARRGKQHTFALMSERVPHHGEDLEGDAALAACALRYFTAHGPAQIQDLTWWASLTAAQIKHGIALCGPALTSVQAEDGKTYYYAPSPSPLLQSPEVRLLPNFDELTVAYKDHAATTDSGRIVGATAAERAATFYRHIITINGRAVGGWTADAKNRVHLRLISGLTNVELKGVEQQIARMAEALQAPVVLANE